MITRPSPSPLAAAPDAHREVATRLGSQWLLTIDTLIDRAREHGIPVEWSSADRTVLELGTGAWRRRLRYTLTSDTSLLGMKLARDKTLSYGLLRRAGLPVPQSIQVKEIEQGLAAAHALGFPVAVKPLDANNARGVTIRIDTDSGVREAVRHALSVSPTGTALVDQSIPGHNYRLTVVGGEVVATHKTIPPSVTGTGLHTVRELIEHGNRAIAQHSRYVRPRSGHTIDDLTIQVLATQGLSLEAVPSLGRRVALRWLGGANGGSNITCFAAPHPVNRKIAVQAAAVVDVDICGVDIVSPDISVPLWTNGGAIVEVNSLVAFRADIGPREGTPTSPDLAVLDMLFPASRPTRIPIIAVYRSARSSPLCERLHAAFSQSGFSVGVSTRSGILVDTVRLPQASANALLHNPFVEIAIIEIDPANDRDSPGPCDLLILPDSLDSEVEAEVNAALLPGETIILSSQDDDEELISNLVSRWPYPERSS